MNGVMAWLLITAVLVLAVGDIWLAAAATRAARQAGKHADAAEASADRAEQAVARMEARLR